MWPSKIISPRRRLSLVLKYVSVDTGLSHLTAALDKPNITFDGPTGSRLIEAQTAKREGGDIERYAQMLSIFYLFYKP